MVMGWISKIWEFFSWGWSIKYWLLVIGYWLLVIGYGIIKLFNPPVVRLKITPKAP
jgi:hypothetical protein